MPSIIASNQAFAGVFGLAVAVRLGKLSASHRFPLMRTPVRQAMNAGPFLDPNIAFLKNENRASLLLEHDATYEIASDVIPAKAGIQTWRPMRPCPLDSRFRGNDTGKSIVGFVLKQRALMLVAIPPCRRGWAHAFGGRPAKKFGGKQNSLSSPATL
jgi:hypothetical protein